MGILVTLRIFGCSMQRCSRRGLVGQHLSEASINTADNSALEIQVKKLHQTKPFPGCNFVFVYFVFFNLRAS